MERKVVLEREKEADSVTNLIEYFARDKLQQHSPEIHALLARHISDNVISSTSTGIV
jgi:hypothetical protein